MKFSFTISYNVGPLRGRVIELPGEGLDRVIGR